ncbi:transketolase family protein [Vulgatibacter incomptus]|nr:transketolase C-terminal domain-containing protein [Vulgatibacter incomptus]
MSTKKATRQAFGEALAKLGETRTDVVVLDADLSVSTKSELFAKKFPDRFFEMGIQEANMLGTAAGLALAGKVPFCCSFACFVTGRYDQIRVSVAYSGANVKIVGTHAGVAIGDDGYSQQGLEDVALMRAIPTMAVVQPADDLETAAAVEYLASHVGPAFLRLTRQNVERVHPEGYRFQFGKVDTLREGTDAVIFASGGPVAPALHAAEALAEDGFSVRVVNVHTIKPLDVEGVVAAAKASGGKVITVEDHTVIGGLGGAIAECLGEHFPSKLKRIGVQDVFGESGAPDAVVAKHGLDEAGITRQVREFLKGA